MTLLVILFLLVAASVTLLVKALLPDPRDRVIRERLAVEISGELGTQKSQLARTLDALAPINQSPKLDKLKQRLDRHLASGHVQLNAIEFLGLQEIIAIGAIMGYVTVMGPAKTNWLFVIIAGAVGFILPDMWLRGRIKGRQETIARDLPEVVDLLSLCVEAGTDFMGAMQRVVREFRACPLIEELSLVIQEIKVGKRRRDALRALARRVDLPDVSSFVRTLVQADRMGTGIAEALRIQSEDSRLRRYHRGERLAQQAPIKMLIPLVFCILPVIGIIVGGPIMLQFMRGDFLPKF